MRDAAHVTASLAALSDGEQDPCPNPKRERGVNPSRERQRPDAVASPLVGDDPSRDRQGVVFLNP
jgi:hypothetical protein